MDKFRTFWDGAGGVVVLVVIALLFVIVFIALVALAENKVEKPKSEFVPYGNHGGNDNRKYGGASDQPGYSMQPVYGTGVSALTCGGKGSAASKLSGAALEVNLLGAMDDYMSASDIALDKSIGSIYTAGTGSSN
jgi:hypothetical protein